MCKIRRRMAGASPEPMQLETRKEQQRFVRIPVESVQSCVDQLGVKTTEEVPGGIVEDVSFRLRQITDVSAVVRRNDNYLI